MSGKQLQRGGTRRARMTWARVKCFRCYLRHGFAGLAHYSPPPTAEKPPDFVPIFGFRPPKSAGSESELIVLMFEILKHL